MTSIIHEKTNCFFKRSFFFFCHIFFLFDTVGFAQTSATTKDGKEIILYPNGYWHYKESVKDIFQYFPSVNKTDVIINHTYYSLSYDTIHHLAKWAIYQLNKEMLDNKTEERKNKFFPDPLLPAITQLDKDYKNSGFDKGHLVPANDMSFSGIAMQESFYYTNVAPQEPSFNRGIWKRLEEQTRKWAGQYPSLVVVCGAILSDTLPVMGIHQISVPYYFYKIIACLSCKEPNAIGFIMPNRKSEKTIRYYAVSVDSIEKITHIDFFPLLENEAEEKMEKNFSLSFWFGK
ncbi:MAG: endonuclease [Bacteroidia bacterium]|nr:MAG: endonuclease [Bacteroidia bacterium]